MSTDVVDIGTELSLPPGNPSGESEYELLDLLGRGGMGIVYKARQRKLGRDVAVKALTHLGNLDPDARARFRAEAETLAKLRHPGIVQVFDAGTLDGVPFLAMEYLSGGSLADRLAKARPAPDEAARLVAAVARAVGYAHAHGVVHRDLKPGNVLLDADGTPKVADFGLARQTATPHLTRTGEVAGTPRYMAPEQLAGERELAPAADVWALGVLLYETLTGTVPFPGDTPERIYIQVFNREAITPRTWLPGLPRDLETICLKCLHKDWSRRYANGSELADDLDRYLGGLPIKARPVGSVERTWRWCRRNPVVAGLTAGVAAVLMVGTVVSLALADWAMTERTQARDLAGKEAALRHEAESASAAETKARREAEAVTVMLDSLIGNLRAGDDNLARLRAQLDATAIDLRKGQGDPATRARLLHTLGVTRRRLGDFAQAAELLEAAHALRSAVYGTDHADSRGTARELAFAYVCLRRGADAVRVTEPLFATESTDLPPDDPRLVPLLDELAVAYHSAGRWDEYEAVRRRQVGLAVTHHGDDSPQAHWARATTGVVYRKRGEPARAVPVYEAALAGLRKSSTADGKAAWVARELGESLVEAGEPVRAVSHLTSAHAFHRSASGPSHPLVLQTASWLALAHERAGNPAAAVPFRVELTRLYETTEGAEAIARGNVLRLAVDYALAGKWDAADALWSRAFEVRTRFSIR